MAHANPRAIRGYYTENEASQSDTAKMFEAIKHGKTEEFTRLCVSTMQLDPLKEKDKSDYNLAIHIAASFDQVQIIQQILQKDPTQLNETNKYEQTPFHLAAMSNRVKTIQFLIKKGAKPNLKDKHGRTPLHLAIFMDKELSYYELIKTGCVDMTTQDNDGNWMLHTAAKCGRKKFCIDLITKRKANIAALNKLGENALFDVVRSTKFSGQKAVEILKCLLPADSDKEKILKQENNNGLTILKAAQQHNKVEVEKYIRQLLQTFNRDILLRYGEEKLDQVKLFVCGLESVGKTTLIESLSKSTSWLKFSFNSTGHSPTPGICVKSLSIPDAGLFNVWDFAGQPEYYLTHSLFLGAHNAITLIVYKLNEENQISSRIIEKTMKWLRFLKSCVDPANISLWKPTVILVGTHYDKVTFNEEVAVQLATSVKDHVQDKFRDCLNIVDDVVILNAKAPNTGNENGICSLRNRLKRERERLCEEKTTKVPKQCVKILTYIANMNSLFPIEKWPDYVQFVQQEIMPDVDEALLRTITQYLHNTGEIFLLTGPSVVPSGSPVLHANTSQLSSESVTEETDQRHTSQEWVVLSTQWLCNVIFGRLLASEKFQIPCMPNKDMYSKGDVSEVFQGVADTDKLIELLCALELCFEVDKQDASEVRLVIPCKLLSGMPPGIWKRPTTHNTHINLLSYGRRIECKDKDIDGFAYSFFPKVQTSLAVFFMKNGAQLLLWRDGLKGSMDCVDFVVQITDEQHAVHVVVQVQLDVRPLQMPYRVSLKTAHDVLNKLMQHVEWIRHKTCPGTATEIRILSSKCLRETTNPSKIKHCYSIEELVHAEQSGNGLVSKHELEDRVDTMLIPGCSHEILQALMFQSNVKWIPMAIIHEAAMKLDVKQIDGHDYTAFAAVIGLEAECRAWIHDCQSSGDSITIRLINEWSKGEIEKKCTIQTMIEIFQRIPIIDGLSKDRGDVVIVLKKIEDFVNSISIPVRKHIQQNFNNRSTLV